MDRQETVRKIKNIGFAKESEYINNVWEAFESNEVDLANMREAYRAQSHMVYEQAQEIERLQKIIKEVQDVGTRKKKNEQNLQVQNTSESVSG